MKSKMKGVIAMGKNAIEYTRKARTTKRCTWNVWMKSGGKL
jgi:hypothetical protein